MRILATADLHLGYKQYGLPERADDFMLAVAYIFHQAQELKVDAIIIPGDIFQSVHPPASAVYFMYRMVKQVESADIKVYGIDGNHDAAGANWMRVCGIIPLEYFDGVNYVPTKMGDLTVIGLNGAVPSVLRTKIDDVAKNALPPVDILVIHTDIAEMCGYQGVELTAAEIADKLRPINTRLVLMGHIHDYKEAEIGGIRFIYTGSTEVNARDEQPTKSFSIITMDKGQLQTAIYPIPTRPVFEVGIKNDKDLDELLATVQKTTAPGGRLPVTIVYYNKDLPDFNKRAEALLNGRVLYRLIPQTGDTQLQGDMFAQLSQQTFERKGALRNLRDVLFATFGENSDEGALILQLMNHPDTVPEIVLNYAKSKGLEIK